MSEKIYGVDLESKITPDQVRDAIVECFYQAHSQSTGFEGQDEQMAHDYCRAIVQKAFMDGGGDYNNPNRSTIMKTLNNLADFAKSFRNPEIIQTHYQLITRLVEAMNKQSEEEL